MAIFFRDRKNKRTLDSSYYLKSGDKWGDVSSFLIGDEIHVLFDVTSEQQEAINEHAPEISTSNRTVHIPCVVVERSRSISWSNLGEFQDLGVTVVLEASSGMWEDVLRWVIFNEAPVWAKEV